MKARPAARGGDAAEKPAREEEAQRSAAPAGDAEQLDGDQEPAPEQAAAGPEQTLASARLQVTKVQATMADLQVKMIVSLDEIRLNLRQELKKIDDLEEQLLTMKEQLKELRQILTTST